MEKVSLEFGLEEISYHIRRGLEMPKLRNQKVMYWGLQGEVRLDFKDSDGLLWNEFGKGVRAS